MTPRKGKSSNTLELDRNKETIQKPYLTDQFFFTKIVVWWDRTTHIMKFSDFLQGIPQKPPSEMAFKTSLIKLCPAVLCILPVVFVILLKYSSLGMMVKTWEFTTFFLPPTKILPTKQRKNPRWNFVSPSSGDILPKCLHGTLHLT